MLKKVKTSILEIAYEERGDANGSPVILMHGFPDDVRTFNRVVEPLAAAGYRTLTPFVRGYGETRFLDENTKRSGDSVAYATDIIEFADALGLEKFAFVGHDWGAIAGYFAAILYPERLKSLIAAAVGYTVPNSIYEQISYEQIQAYWYQWHFNTEKGRETLAADRIRFSRKFWKFMSPDWNFTDAEFEQSAQSWHNPDFVDVIIDSYRRRWNNSAPDPRYAHLMAKLKGEPKIAVPTITIVGALDGATLLEQSENKEQHFTGFYERQVLDGIGHFIPREKPEAVIEAVLKLTKSERQATGG